MCLTHTPRPRDPLNPQHNGQASNLRSGIFNGFLSPATRRRVGGIVETWLRSIMLYRTHWKPRWDPGQPYPVFLTVTLPGDQVHTDQHLNRYLLAPLIQALKQSHGISHYFWRAEAQERGAIHWHILTDRYISKEDLRATWNRILERLGYISRYTEATGKTDPPSTEIHAIRNKVKDRKTGKWRSVDPVQYLLGYVLDTARPRPDEIALPGDPKDPRRLVGTYRTPEGSIERYIARPIGGRAWGMSDGIRDLSMPKGSASVRLVQVLDQAALMDQCRRIDTDHATLYYGPVHEILARRAPAIHRLILNYYRSIIAAIYPTCLRSNFRNQPGLEEIKGCTIDLHNLQLVPLDLDAPQPPALALAARLATTWITVRDKGRDLYTPLDRYIQQFPRLGRYTEDLAW